MTNIESVIELLNSFPSQEAVAKFMKARGIKGEKRRTCLCPIAVFVTNETGQRASAVPRCDRWPSDLVLDDNYDDPYPLSDTISDFIESFDNGDFPDLIA